MIKISFSFPAGGFKIVPGSVVKSGSNGYEYCETIPTHPHALKLPDRNKRYVYLHIVKMENSLKRLLDLNKEEVHHKNGNTSDNNLSNLELKLKGEHQRDHALSDNKFWKHSPRTKPGMKRKARAVLDRFLKCKL